MKNWRARIPEENIHSEKNDNSAITMAVITFLKAM